MTVPTTLVVTNDFPPRIGGIESFVDQVCTLLDGEVVVYASGPPGAAATDAARPYPVVWDGSLLLPTARVARRAAGLLRRHRATRVVFGAAAPLGLLAPALRAAGATQILGLTHGHEVWWAGLPGSRAVLRRIGDACDHLGVISDYTAGRIGSALSPAARDRMVRLPPPVDTALFSPARSRGDGRPRCVTVGRFVAQKGHDVLLRAWAQVCARVPAGSPLPELVLVGDGPRRRRLEGLVAASGLGGAVRFTGALGAAGVLDELRRAWVFALPVRTRLAGLNPEGLGLAALEAAACGLPVLVGDSGGAPETVRHGVSGYVVPSHDVGAWARRLTTVLADPDRAAAMGARGRDLVRQHYGAGRLRAALRHSLDLDG